MSKVNCIWERKRCTNEFLISDYKVKPETCYVFFSDDEKYTEIYEFDGTAVINANNKQKNGKGVVYVVPCSWLKFKANYADYADQLDDYKKQCHEEFLKYCEKRKKKRSKKRQIKM